MAFGDGFDKNSKDLNVQFLGILVGTGVLSIVFLLYLNRAVGSVVSWALRTWVWRQHGIFIDISALQLSLLGGRIFFTGLRYHGSNETILVQNGCITWSYWLRWAREVDLGQSGVPKNNSKLPCRVSLSLQGLEWFIYNRSPAYASILAALTETTANDDPSTHAQPFTAKEYPADLETPHELSMRRAGGHGSSEPRGDGRAHLGPEHAADGSRADVEHGVDLPLFLQVFPISLECEKAALVMGNENTRSILTIKAASLGGEITAAKSPTPDLYRQIIHIDFKHPVIQMKENLDFKEDLAARATREGHLGDPSAPRSAAKRNRSLFRQQRRRLLSRLRSLVPRWMDSVESISANSNGGAGAADKAVPGLNHWQGLSRYLDEDGDDQKSRWASVEYAAVPTVLDSPEASLTVLWDVPGKVGFDLEAAKQQPSGLSDINGEKPPAWSINISVKGGSVVYGPWADRQRAELQRMFVPSLCQDAVPAKRLAVGADRMPTRFELHVQLDDVVTVRIPTREESKNWRWRGQEPNQNTEQNRGKRKARERSGKPDKKSAAKQQRPHGWLDIKVGTNATVSYSMDTVARPTGFMSTLELDLPSTEISSSINHELLWRSGRMRVDCDLSTPLRWNGLREWRFNVVGDELKLYLLRDHVFLLTDLVDDWASGPPAEYLVFTPFKYYLDLRLSNVKLFLNVNDGNIIDNPTDPEDNAYIIFSSPLLASRTCIPLDNYRPHRNSIPFHIRAETVSVALHSPIWNTQASFLPVHDVGQVETVSLDGSYNFNSTTSQLNTDTLVLNLSAQSPVATLHGFTIRYFLKVKDNYFGEDTHFKTWEEFQGSLRPRDGNLGVTPANKPHVKKSNDFDLMLNVRVDDPKVMLPTNIYSSHRHVQIDTANLSVELRLTNYYMDLAVTVAPLSLSLGAAGRGAETRNETPTCTQLFIDGLEIYGNRVLGVPPTEPTYMCNWDFSVGAVRGDCTVDFIRALASGGNNFVFSFEDDENALVSWSSLVVCDVTFLRASVQSISIWMHVEEAAFLLSTSAIKVRFNDWAGTHYSKRADITIPNIKLSCVTAESASHNKDGSHHSIETEAYVQTSLHMASIGRKLHFSEERQRQQQLIRHEDQRTHRVPFLLLPDKRGKFVPDAVDPPSQPVPPIPQPVTMEDVDPDFVSLRSTGTSRRSRGFGRHNSILSLNKSISSGIVKSNSSRHTAAHSTVTFSSPYFAPSFPLDGIFPDTKQAVSMSIEFDEQDDEDSVKFSLEDVDPDVIDEGCAYSSTLLDFSSGLTAFLTPASLHHIAALLSAWQLSDPEDVLDSLQIGSITEILAMEKRQTMAGHISDVQVRLPQAKIRFLSPSDMDSLNSTQDAPDQYDVTISKLAFASRTDRKWEDVFRPDSQVTKSSFHLRFRSLELSVAEKVQSVDDIPAAAFAHLEQVMVSLGSKEVVYLDVEVGNVQCSTSSEKLDYLASLVHRAGVLAADLGPVFGETMSHEERFLQYFTHRLVTEGQQAPDPDFLNRPSAVLRSVSQHLRTFDSWKLIMRLRQMWTVLSSADKEKLKLDCLRRPLDLAADARQEVHEAIQRWRSWDLENLSESVLWRRIFGRAEKGTQASAVQPGRNDERVVRMVARIKQLQVTLDPGPKQNEVTLLDVTARVDMKTPTADDEPRGPENEVGVPLTVINLYCSDAALNLNWELCELAAVVFRLVNKMGSKENPEVSDKALASSPMSGVQFHQQRIIHCVAVLARSTAAFEAINLHASSHCEGMKASLLVRTGFKEVSDTNLTATCDVITSRLHSHSQKLAKFTLGRPSIFVSHELHADSTTDFHTIKATASSHDLSLAVRQDPIALSEVLDLLVRDEIAQLYRLKDDIPSSYSTPVQPVKGDVVKRLPVFRVNMAMFMDNYSLSAPLLQSLTYTVQGTVARVSMAANSGQEIIIDFDVKENMHDMQVRVQNRDRSISLLQIPPTNGRVSIQTGTGSTSIGVFASVELIELDASAVYSLLSALNRPEIMNSINELQKQARTIQDHMKEIFGESQTPGEAKDQKKGAVAYSIHLTFAGLRVFGNSPIKYPTAPIAHVLLWLDSVHFEMTNRLKPHEPILEQPEFHVNLRNITFEISKGNAELMNMCGRVGFGALVTATSRKGEDGQERRFFNVKSESFQVDLSPDTVSTAIDVLGYMGDKISDLDTSRELDYLRKLRQSKPRVAVNGEEADEEADMIESLLSSTTYTFEVCNVQIIWMVTVPDEEPSAGKDDLVFSLERLEFGTRTRNSARLTMENLQVQMVSPLQENKPTRSSNSALMPEIMFNVGYVTTPNTRRMAFQAIGKSVDFRLTSGFIIPAAHLVDSISLSVKNVQQATQQWSPAILHATNPSAASPTSPTKASRKRGFFGGKRMESVLVDADFAGAVVHLTGKKAPDDVEPTPKGARPGLRPKAGQANREDAMSSTDLHSPGLAWKLEYRDGGKEDPSLYAEVNIDASSNILYPSVVPVIVDITNSLKEAVSSRDQKEAEDKKDKARKTQTPVENAKSPDEENIFTTDPSTVLGRTKLNLGLRICKQEFSLSCQPIARVAATASFEDVYLTVNTVRSVEHGNFLAMSATCTKLQASVQHVYSRESTGSFAVESIVLSLMNSKHVSGVSGLSAMLEFSPVKVSVNAKQLQDFMLFREIWLPKGAAVQRAPTAVAKNTPDPWQGHLAQRYQQVAATAAFPWTATISISELEIVVDLGQALGKSTFAITDFWVSSKKTSDWEQNLCLGFQKMGVDSVGRMSGFVALEKFQLRTCIRWPEREQALNETPLVQASVGFSQFRVKAAFDYQAFLVGDMTSLQFFMYNVRRTRQGSGDRLVAIFEGDKAQVFGTTSSAAQAIALYKALERLVQERTDAFEASVKEMERFTRRKSVSAPAAAVVQRLSQAKTAAEEEQLAKAPISLDTDVVVTLKALNMGVFPSALTDHQVFKMEALNAQARFAASIDSTHRVHSILGLTLGQLRIGLAAVRSTGAAKAPTELSIEDVVRSATGARGGTIVKVPRVEAVMQTWQTTTSKKIDYIFKTSFEGKIDVGWNWSRISYIRGMYANHSRALEQVWGRGLPSVTAIRVTGVPELTAPDKAKDKDNGAGTAQLQHQKITAEVKVPQSRYDYNALEPPVIETPQLRDMGEATPPLEWIGLNRDRLPNLTHQIIIVSLLELAGEVEDAYSRILGSS